MRRSVVAFFAGLGIVLSSLTSPAAAVTLEQSSVYHVMNTFDVPASAIDASRYPDGSYAIFWLANGNLYRQLRNSSVLNPPTAVYEVANQSPDVPGQLQARVNAAGELALVFTCSSDSIAKLCIRIERPGLPTLYKTPLAMSGVSEFDAQWRGSQLEILAVTAGNGKNPVDGPRTWLTHATVAKDNTVTYDNPELWLDPSVAQFNAYHVGIAVNGDNAVYSWESYESTGNSLRFVVRSKVIRAGNQSGTTTHIVADLGSERVRALRGSWLESSVGLVPTLMWVTDSAVGTTNESAPETWATASSVALAGQALLADILVTDQGVLQASVKTRHVTTPVLTSFTLSDTRLPIVSATVVANAFAISAIKSYQMFGGDPAVFTCTGSSVSLLNAVTGAVIRSNAVAAQCKDVQLFDYSGRWILTGISTDYSTIQNSPHAVQWIDAAAATDLSPTDGRLAEQDYLAIDRVNINAYVARDWVDPLVPSLTRDRLRVQAFDPVDKRFIHTTVSDPAMAVSNVILVETAEHKAVLLWQESASTLFGTTASSVKAAVFDPTTFTWSATATASLAGLPLVTLGVVAEGGSGTGQAGSTVMMDASFFCQSCFTPLHGLLSFDPASNSFQVLGAEPSGGAPALAAAQLGNGDTAWIFSTEANNFEPWLYVRSSAGWSSGVPLGATVFTPGSRPQILAYDTSAASGRQAVVLYNEYSPNSPMGILTMQRLDVTGTSPQLTPKIVLEQNAQRESNAVFDGQGRFWQLLKYRNTLGQPRHGLISVNADDMYTSYSNLSTAEDLHGDITADSLGRITLAWHDGNTVFATQADPSGVSTRMLGLLDRNEIPAIFADGGSVGAGVSWCNRRGDDNILASPLAITRLEQSTPPAPTMVSARHTSTNSVDVVLSAQEADPYTRFEYRAAPGSAQNFTSGIDADGTITISGINVAQSLSIDARVINNYGTAYETVGAWATFAVDALTVSPVNVSNVSWNSATSAHVEWQMLSDTPYQYEVSFTQDGKTVTATSAGNSYDFQTVDSLRGALIKVRASLWGVTGPWSAVSTLTAATRPAASKITNLKPSKSAVALSWTRPLTQGLFGATGYRVEMRIGTASWKTVATVKLTALNWTLKKPIKGKKYSFRVTVLGPLVSAPSVVKSLTFKG